MRRDKQIDEMAKHCCFPCLMGNGKCVADLNSSECYVAIETANHLYNAGYRKASEVAEEIFAEIEFEIAQLDFDREETRAIAIEGIIAELKKKYTEGEG